MAVTASAGFDVEVALASVVRPSDAVGRSVVVISESCNSIDVGDKFRDITAGVVVAEPAVWDDMKMIRSNAIWSSDYGDLLDQENLLIVDPTHQIAKDTGLTGLQRVSERPSKFVWAKPEATAQIVATIGGHPSKAGVFTYERNAQMASLRAPGRRAGIFPGRDAPAYFTTAGKKIISAVVRWAAMPTALLVVNDTNLSTGDQKIEDVLASRGFSVRRIRANSLTAADFAGVALCAVSESTQSTELSDTQQRLFATTRTPLLMFEPALWDDAGMVGPVWDVDFGNITSASQIQFISDGNRHPLSADQSGTVQVSVRPQTFLWGRTFGPGVSKVATVVGQQDKVALFAYDKGAALVDGTGAPARRVGMFADRNATADLSDQGLSILTRAIDWAAAGSARVEQSLQLVHSCRIAGDQDFAAAFVYENLGTDNLYVPRGSLNSVLPANTSGHVPLWFASGRHTVVLRSAGAQEIRWKLGTKELAVSQSSSICTTATGTNGRYLVADGVQVLLDLGGAEASAGAIVQSDIEAAGEVVDGEATVGHDGSASYYMPLWMPPAPGGVPSVGIQYNSSRSSDRGVLGAGFELAGLSEIRRCGKTWNRDGQPSSVKFNTDDALCFDGQRLIKVSENSTSIEYRTEIDTFSKVIAHGKGAEGPEFFEVMKFDGSTSLFGATTDSKLRGERRIQKSRLDVQPTFTSETVTLSWGISRRTDVSGWTTVYKYDLLPTSIGIPGVEWRIAEISYGGNAKTQRVADRSVRFIYQPRSNTTELGTLHSFQGGLQRLYTSLLSNIDLLGPTTNGSIQPLRRYKFGFLTGSEKQPLLKTVSACDEFQVCTRPTTFDWQENSNEIFETVKTGINDLTPPGLENYWMLHTGDFNGDGYSDILYRRLGNSQSDHGPANPTVHEDWVLRFSDGNVFGPAKSVGDQDVRYDTSAQLPDRGFFAKWHYGTPIDLNTDGLTDFLGVSARTAGRLPHWRPIYSRPPLLGNLQFRWSEIDLDGDGFVESDELEEEKGAAPSSVNGNDLDTKYPYKIYVADLDGDGLPEIIRPMAPTGSQKFATWGFRKNLGNSFADYAPLVVDIAVDNVTPTGPQTAIFGEAAFTHDLDGDGRVEFLYAPFDPATGDLPSGASLQKGYVAFVLDHGVGRATPTNHRLEHRFGYITKWPGDFNGDGLLDYVASSTDGFRFSLSLNTGAGFIGSQHNVDPGDCPIGNSRVFTESGNEVSGRDNGLRVADFDNDGDDDILLLDGPFANHRSSKVNLQVLIAEAGADGVNFKCAAVKGAGPNGAVIDLPAGKATGYIGSNTRGIKTPGYRLSQTADVDGDGSVEILQIDPSGELIILRRNKGPAHHLSSITDGRNSKTRFVYTPLSNSTFHTRTASGVGLCNYPFRCPQGGQYVVAAKYIDSGVEPKENIFFYNYENAVADVTGNGWLGFHKRLVRDLRRGSVTAYEYDPTRTIGGLRPFGGLPTAVQVTTTMGTVKHDVRTTYRRDVVPSIEFPESGINAIRLVQTTTKRSESRGGGPSVQITNVDTTMKHEDYFNETYRRVETYLSEVVAESERHLEADVLERTTSYEPPNVDTWLLSRPSKVVEKHTEKDGASVTRTSSFTSDPVTGLLSSRTIEPGGNDDEKLDVVFERNAAGQITGVRQSDKTGNVRTESVILDQTGLFPAFSVNAVGHTTRTFVHPGYGVPLFVADENMNITSTKYDGFLRPKEVRYPTGAIESLDYYGAVSTSSGPSVRRITTAGTETRTFVDRLGRPKTILSRRNLSGQNYFSYTDIEYDSLGRVKSASQPHFADETPVLTKYEYDQLDRLTKWTDPAGAITSREYENRIIRQTDPNDSKKEAKLDLHGRLIGLVHNVSSPHADMAMQYAPFSALSRVTMSDPARGMQERVFGYDVFGRQTSAQEPDVGTRTLKYNAYGDIREETSASNDVLVYRLDGLGRPRRVEDNATGKAETFTWDASQYGLGQLAASMSFDNVASEYGYSKTSQLAFQQNKVGDVSLPMTFTYDAQDRLETVMYPGPTPASAVARYFYDDANGELDAVTFAGALLWKRVVADALGRTRREGFANGTLTFTDFNARGDIDSIKTQFSGLPTVQDLEFSYFPDGDLEFRSDHLLSTTEWFTYDDQRRLRTWSIEGGGTTTWEHDGFGNIKSRLNSGTLGLPSVTFNYPAGSSNEPSSSSLGAVYKFDPRGRVTATDVHKSITYTPFDLPNRLEAAKGDVFTLTYDANHQRASKVGPEGSTLYLGQHYERVERPLEPLTHVMHIHGNTPLADIVWRDGEADYEIRCLHRDRLGSVDAVTDRTGKLLERRKFDPFGAPIDPQLLVPVPFPSALTAGFTGHPHDPDLGLINMQGRLFDATSMRFLTPDPVVSDLADSQAWNPYSYAGQMPFDFTDPTGFERIEAGEFVIDVSDHPSVSGRSPQQTDSEVPGTRVVDDKKPARKATADDSGGVTIADLQELPVSQSGPVFVRVVSSDSPQNHSRPVGGPSSPLFGESPGQLLSRPEFTKMAERLSGADTLARVGANIPTLVPLGGGARAAVSARPGLLVRFWRTLFPVAIREPFTLERASEAAFKAAANADKFTAGAKHLAGAAGKWAKFAEGLKPNAILREALESSGARFLPNDASSFKVVTDLGRAVGAKGETGIRAIVDFEGHVVTWFPVRP